MRRLPPYAAPRVRDESLSVTHGNGKDLNGLRVLVVEDEAAISLLLEDMLLDLGCEVVGPAARLASALELASNEALDLAILDVNLKGPFLVCREVAPTLIAQRGGVVINVASIAGVMPIPLESAYCASKAGLIRLTRALALD